MKEIKFIKEKLDLISKGNIDAILLINYNNLGDLICDSPSLRNIRRAYPLKKIILLVRNKICIDLMKNFKYVDEIIEIPHSKEPLNNYYEFCKKLKKYNFEFSIQFVRPFNEIYRTYIPYMLNISKRLGLLQKDYIDKYNEAFTDYILLNNNTTRTEESLELLKLLDINIDSDKTECFINDKNIMHYNHRKYIIVQTCATMISRMWHKNNFINLINLILDKYSDIDILLTGSTSEDNYIEEIRKEINNSRVYKYTNINIDTLLNYIKNAELIITNDTGPYHFARAFNIKRIVLFGISPKSYLINKKEENSIELCGNCNCPVNCFVKKIDCNCANTYKMFGEKYNCINTINYIDVFNCVTKLLDKKENKMTKNEKLISLLPIKTKRLVIKPTSIDDIDMILKMDKQEITQMFLGGVKSKTKEERIKFLEKKADKFKNNIVGSLTIFLKNGIQIGFVSFDIDENNNNAEISYIFDLDYCNKGYCTEICTKLIDIAFKKLKLNKVYADTIEGNESSKRVLEKLGFQKEGCRRKTAYVNTLKEYRDFLDYGILISEYKK